MPKQREIPYESGHFFITFTCYQWMPLIEISNSYDLIYKWFDYLKEQGHYITGYIIMPNHIHVTITFRKTNKSFFFQFIESKPFTIMYRILLIIFFIPIVTMSQTITFSKAVQQLYFNVDVKNASIDAIINELSNIAIEHSVSKGMYSLSVNLDMNVSGNAKKVSHVFKFNKSPLPNMSVDAGYIKVIVGEGGGNERILDVDWCFQFLNKTDAEKFFEELNKIFTPISTKQKIADDKLNSGQYAEFSTRSENAGEIRDVTFFFGKNVVTNKYEVRFIPYNEFME